MSLLPMRCGACPPRRLHLPRDNRAIAALEFALVAPVLILVLAGIVDLGMQLYTRMQLESALDAGANYAVVNMSKVEAADSPTLASTIANLVANANGGLGVTATVDVNNGASATASGSTSSSSGSGSGADQCYCPTGSPSSWTWGDPVACGTSCAGGGLAGKFVTIMASYAYIPVISGFSFASSGTVTVSTLVQTQ